jgi:selenocysteine-specific elongation factor
MVTIAGATLLDAAAPRHKRYRAAELADLAARADGSLAENLLAVLQREGQPLTAAELARAAQLPLAEIMPALNDLQADGRMPALDVDGEKQYISATMAENCLQRALTMLEEYHQKYPLRRGLPQAELRSRLFATYKQKPLQALLLLWQQGGFIRLENVTLALPQFKAQPAAEEGKLLERIIAIYEAAAITPPLWADIVRECGLPTAVGGEYLLWLAENGYLLRVGELCFAAAAVEQAERILRGLDGPEGFTLAQARDALNSSRKYVQPLVEYFDERKITRREGDIRHFLT